MKPKESQSAKRAGDVCNRSHVRHAVKCQLAHKRQINALAQHCGAIHLQSATAFSATHIQVTQPLSHLSCSRVDRELPAMRRVADELSDTDEADDDDNRWSVVAGALSGSASSL